MDTSSSARQTAASIGSDVKQVAHNRLEDAQGKTSESLRTFAEAIRHAGDELAGKDQGPAAQILTQAAGGLEQISSAIGQKRIEDIVGDVRRFGREHPGAFMLGSVLVGLALGRFAQSAVPPKASPTSPGRDTELRPYGETPGGTNGVE